MKFKKSLSLLVTVIAVLAFLTALFGVLSVFSEGSGFTFKSINGVDISIFGKGLYKNDSVSVATQGIAQDIVTLILGLPLLIISLIQYRKGGLKGRLLLCGTIAYFLYTYTSYSFLWMFNRMFIVYVMLMSASLFAFILCMMSFDLEKLPSYFSDKLPRKFIAGLLIFIGSLFGLMWLKIVVPPSFNGVVPANLEHYTTFVIQAMDLAFVVPTAFVSGILLIKRKPFGYLLSSVVIVKGITMLTALTFMVIGQKLIGDSIALPLLVVLPALNIVIIFVLVTLMKNINEPKKAE